MHIFRKYLVIGLLILFVGASVTPNIIVRNVSADGGTAEWYENFDDGDIGDWTIENPYPSV